MSRNFGYICGNRDQSETIGTVLNAMARRLQRAGDPPPVARIDSEHGIGLGCLGTKKPGDVLSLNLSDPKTGVALLDGEIYGLVESCGLNQSHEKVLSNRDAGVAMISQLYEMEGSEFGRYLDGSFCIAVYDARQRKLIIVTDRFATRTLYWTMNGKFFAFCTELKGLLAVPFLCREMDWIAVSQYLTMNSILGERTFMRDVRRLQPAAMLMFDLVTGAITESRYWSPEHDIQERARLTAERMEAISESFHGAVKRRIENGRNVGASLSGGLDSRAIVAVASLEGAKIATVTEGMEGCSDQRVADRIARITSSSHTFYPLTTDAIRRYLDALRMYVYLTDGMCPTVDGFPGTSFLIDHFCTTYGVDVLLRGHGGEHGKLETAWPFCLSRTLLNARDMSQLASHMMGNLWSIPSGIDAKCLLQDGRIDISRDAAQRDLQSLIDELPADLSPAEVIDLIYLRQMDGNTVSAWCNSVRGCVEVGLPYLDYRFMSLIIGTCADDRLGPDIHHYIIDRSCPALMAIANSNTGAPLNASKLRLYMMDKFTSVMKRLQVPGFRHYQYMHLWIKDFLADGIRDFLIADRTFDRNLYDRRLLIDLIDQVRSNASLSPILIRLTFLEQWCRLFLDDDDPDPPDTALFVS